jgi:hypothetical protein
MLDADQQWGLMSPYAPDTRFKAQNTINEMAFLPSAFTSHWFRIKFRSDQEGIIGKRE